MSADFEQNQQLFGCRFRGLFFIIYFTYLYNRYDVIEFILSLYRVLGRRRLIPDRRPYYDEKDKAALRLMRKLRQDPRHPKQKTVLPKVAGL